MRASPVLTFRRASIPLLALGLALGGCPDDSTAPEENYRLYWFFQNTSDADVTFEVEDEGGASTRTVVVSPGQPTVVETEDFYRTPTTSIRVMVRAGPSTTADTRKVISVRKGFSEEITSSWNGCDLTVRTEPGDAIENLVAASCAGAAGIFFSSSRDGNAEIYVLDQNGLRNLTQNPAADRNPTVHGARIYFSSDRSGNFEIYSMNFDGSSITRLTNNSVADHWPAAGTNKIAFTRDVGGGREQIFTMNLDGSNQTNVSNNAFHEGTPAWSPFGDKLVYASDRDAKFGPLQYLEIYSMNADGTGVTRLTFNDNGIDYHPAWSPDGSKIAFTSNRSANPTNPSDPTCYEQALEIWVMNADGSGLRNLTNHCRGDVWPAWSPDGTEIVFASDRGTTTNFAWDLWKIPASGGTATRLTATGKDANPVWR